MGDLTDAYVRRIQAEVAGWPEQPGAAHVNELLRMTARWRSRMLKNTYLGKQGPHIMAGPFAGKTVVDRVLDRYTSIQHFHNTWAAIDAKDSVNVRRS